MRASVLIHLYAYHALTTTALAVGVGLAATPQTVAPLTGGVVCRLAHRDPPSTAPAEATDDTSDIVSLADSLAPLVSRFNTDKDKVRFVALLSPT